MNSKNRTERRKNYFRNLLNGTQNNPIQLQSFQRAEPFIDQISREEMDADIVELKNWKVPGSDDKTTKLIK